MYSARVSGPKRADRDGSDALWAHVSGTSGTFQTVSKVRSQKVALLSLEECAFLGRHGAVAKGIIVERERPFLKWRTYTMPYLLVRHKVEDYERWKPVFDHDHGATREQSGSKGGPILRNPDDPTSW